MEYFWYVIAAVGAGIGTGLAGLSAATVMVPILAAVGTSTFIMTFTALIGFSCHALIHPAIVLERWDVLVLCMAVTTAASLVSAQFANRVQSKAVGWVTGVLLVVLGTSMIYLNYFC